MASWKRAATWRSPWGELFRKDVTIGMGRDHDERYNVHLRDLIVAGRVSPGVVVSHRLPLADAPEAFRRFGRRVDGFIKVVLDPTTDGLADELDGGPR